MHRVALAVSLLLLATCKKEGVPEAPPPPEAKAPKRTAMQDEDLRVFLADIAASKACNLVRGKMRALRDPKRPDVATGTMWIKGCRITSHGTKIDFHLSGEGWQWAEETTKKAGAKFAVHQYVRFGVEATIPGSLDISYGKKQHVLSLWFTPTAKPDVHFKTIGGVDVDEQGAWSSILGTLSSAVGKSPDKQGAEEAKSKGSHEFQKSFADGVSVTIDACTGLSRFSLGRPATGRMGPPDVGETRKVPVELQADGVMATGPYLAPRRMTAEIQVEDGAVLAELYCAADAEKVVDAYLHEGVAMPKPLASKIVRGRATLRARRPGCDVMFVARAVGYHPATFAWNRPVTEEARSTGGPLIDCDKD